MFTLFTFLIASTMLALLVVKEVIAGLGYPVSRRIAGMLNAATVPLACIFFIAVTLKLLLPLQ